MTQGADDKVRDHPYITSAKGLGGWGPSTIYSWSIGHILEHEFFYLGHLGCAGNEKNKVDLSFSEQMLRAVFSTFCGQKLFF